MFVIGFVCQLGVIFVIGFVCQFGVMFGIGFVCLWVGKNVILPFTLGKGLVLDFSIKDLKLSHGFQAKNGLTIGHIGNFFKNFFYVAFFVMCGTMGYLFHVWGGVSVGL